MSLQVWLPLDGDLRNQGLTDIIVTNNGATIDNNGKIGKCYNFNGSSYIDTGYKESIGTGDFSISAWIYITQTSGKTYQCIIGNKSTGAVSVGFAIYWNQNQKKFLWSTADGSAATEIWSTDTFDTIIYNSWHHIVMCRNNNDSRKGYFYLDGVRKEIASIPTIRNITSTTSIKIGSVTPSAAAYYFTGKINDIRIYDHALSAKEVKELSKGLILHYPMNGFQFCENILTNSSGYQGTTNWGGLTSVGEENGYKYLIAKRTDTTSTSRTFCTHTAITSLVSSWQPGDKFTISGWYKVPSSETQQTGGNMFIRWAQSSASNGDADTGFTTSTTVKDIWIRFENTYTVPPNFASGKAANFYLSAFAAQKVATVYWKEIKLEKGDKATPWCPAKTDTLYSALGYDSNIESDCSGYKRDGIITGTIIGNTDTPRYRTSSNITNNSSYIKTDNLITTGFENSYSFSWWAKVPNYNNMHWGFANGIRLNGMYTGKLWNTGDSSNNPIYQPGTTTQITVPSANIWHHFVMTGDGTSCKLYVDGKHYGTAKTYKKISGTTLIINGWDTGTSYSGQINISDFRIYCTALSADDIKALYEDAGYVDKNGNFHAYEFVEE